jgi:serine/threonine protein kinase
MFSSPCLSLKKLGRRIEEEYVRPLFFQMATAVWECHSRRVFHHDIKLENFVLVPSSQNPQNKEVKLIDFGFAVELGGRTTEIGRTGRPKRPREGEGGEEEEVRGRGRGRGRGDSGDDTYIDNYFAGSPAYQSPQVLAKKAHSAAKTDVFSLGVCLFVMTFSCFPFCDVTKDSLEDLRRNISKPLRFPSSPSSSGSSLLIYAGGDDKTDQLTQSAKELLLGMLAFHEHKRLSMEQVLQHDFFRK